jgi:transposase
MAVEITRTSHSPQDLRSISRTCGCTRQAGRLLALALVLDGASRTEAARAGGMDRQTLRDWAHRYNEAGPEGLRDKPRSGRKPRLSGEQIAEVAAWTEAGPDPAKDKVVRWRCADVKTRVKDRFGVDLSERQIGQILNDLGFRRMSVRPRHPQADPARQDEFKKTSPRP